MSAAVVNGVFILSYCEYLYFYCSNNVAESETHRSVWNVLLKLNTEVCVCVSVQIQTVVTFLLLRLSEVPSEL